MLNTSEKLTALAGEIKKNNLNESKVNILVSMGTCGLAAGAKAVYDALSERINKSDQGHKIKLIKTGCLGLCHSEPTIEIQNKQNGSSLLFGNVTPEQANKIIQSSMGEKDDNLEEIERTWFYPEDEENVNKCIQARIALRNSGQIDPEKINDYIAHSGYSALSKALTTMTPEEVINEILESGLRGRGGGGFPTGKKWQFAASQKSKIKYLICNADEGDPGAFMDRAVLEGDPHVVLEAMTISGYAIGASTGLIYIRAEYPLAIERLNIAIEQAKDNGLLGKNIFGSGFDFDIEIKYGAGAFVCGEETALIRSIEGQRGMPTYKPPFPAISGLWGKPTIVNNVETFANICPIIRKGSKWFKKIGTENSSGTKVFALAGKIDKVGLVEVPMGTPLKKIIYDVGNGIKGENKFKAVQTGGPSGGCIPTDHLDTPIDYDSLSELGSMMGSGGMIVLDETDCMVNIAKFFLNFTLDESCGKCTPCRVGGSQMFRILDKITKGNGTEADIDLLNTLAETIKSSSLCGLGQTSPNPVLATLRFFPNEYREHVIEKKCHAGKCKELISYVINSEKCIGCTVCAKACPVKCIHGKVKEIHEIDQKNCIRCGACFDSCKFKAINKS